LFKDIKLKILYAIALIVLGTFLEWYYYVARFESDGIQSWLAWVIALSLTVLLATAVIYRKRTLGRVLMIAIICYSVINTNAGQEFSLSVKQQETVVAESHEANGQDEITELTRRQAAIDAENAQILSERKRNLIGSTEASRRQEPLRVERDNNTLRLRELRGGATTHATTREKSVAASNATNTYTFYRDLIGIPESWLRFAFHLILSVFIALMVPLGLLALSSDKIAKPTSLPKLREGFVPWWARANFLYYERNKKPMTRPMILAHVKNAKYTEEQLAEIESLMPTIDFEAGEAKLIADVSRMLKLKRKEETKHESPTL
jgi:hypothetical protein